MHQINIRRMRGVNDKKEFKNVGVLAHLLEKSIGGVNIILIVQFDRKRRMITGVNDTKMFKNSLCQHIY